MQTRMFRRTTRPKIMTCSRLLKTGCNNVVLPTLFIVVNNIVQHCWAGISPQSGVIMLNNTVDNYEQYGQHNIVASCFQQPWTSDHFFRVRLVSAASYTSKYVMTSISIHMRLLSLIACRTIRAVNASRSTHGCHGATVGKWAWKRELPTITFKNRQPQIGGVKRNINWSSNIHVLIVKHFAIWGLDTIVITMIEMPHHPLLWPRDKRELP